ncbi:MULTISPECIES: glycosyltransferase family 39 protein [Methanobacterium]|uniref:Glycosyltransferase family 39 protein n=1 Tax=Methanobacterium veterum TaxID=408577 RepID=A0A9E5A5E0_9EURY|nr:MULTISPECIES: glycosyltransferase family 39 protein [Methanobacterium]MCZ3364917.1 glycosyltransferase family 39 protein [Methanobacterium veterum]MCZ3372672.1 glycosyltransferase family 39 protein [Methanobacterium veterum]
MGDLSNSHKLFKKYSGHILLAVLVIIVSLITYYRVKIQMDLGPIWDTYDFLSNALLFAGQGTGYSDLTRPPVLPFLTSILFRLGYTSSISIFIVDGLLFIFGVIGLFLLLKLQFNDILSFLGSLLYATFPIIISFVGVGLSDIPSVSFAIWTIYFTILAVKKNSKFFYLSFPLMMLTFLTRYPSALLIFPVLFYILINRKSVEIKDIIIGISSSLLLLIPVLIFFYEVFGNPFYSFLNFFGSSSATVSTNYSAYNPDILYFIKNLPLFIGDQLVTIIFIIILCFGVYLLFKSKKAFKSKIKLFNTPSLNKITVIKLILFIILTLAFVGTFGKLYYMGSEILFFAMAYLLYDLVKNLNINNIDIHLLVFAWFMAFFIFHSAYSVKDYRYFVTMAPAVAYFLILSINQIYGKLEFKIKNINVTSYLFSIILIIIIISSTMSCLSSVQETNNNLKIIDQNMKSASQWLINYDPNYETKTVYSDLWPYSGWYLKMNIGMMPIFRDDQMYYTGTNDHNFSQQDSIAANNYLVRNNVYYCFSTLQKLNLTSYKPIKQIGKTVIYKRV